jgi:hypothetical protein
MTAMAGVARGNLGYIAALQGDLPVAMAAFADAEIGLSGASARASMPRMLADHAQALADAALFDDADALLTRSVSMLEDQGQQTELAGGRLTVAEVRLAKGDAAGAVEAAQHAAAAFEAQGRANWAAVASALALQARSRMPPVAPDVAAALISTADVLAAAGWTSEAIRSRLLASMLAANGGSVASLVDRATRRAA